MFRNLLADYRLDVSKKVLPSLRFYIVICMHITLDLVQKAVVVLFHKEMDLIQEFGVCNRGKDWRIKTQGSACHRSYKVTPLELPSNGQEPLLSSQTLPEGGMWSFADVNTPIGTCLWINIVAKIQPLLPFAFQAQCLPNPDI